MAGATLPPHDGGGVSAAEVLAVALAAYPARLVPAAALLAALSASAARGGARGHFLLAAGHPCPGARGGGGRGGPPAPDKEGLEGAPSQA